MNYKGFNINIKKVKDGYIASVINGGKLFWKKKDTSKEAVKAVKRAIDKFSDDLDMKTIYTLKKGTRRKRKR